MLGNRFSIAWRIDGTLAANKTIAWKLPYPASLLAVSAGASNDSDATLKVGTSADDDAYLLAATIGDSGAPVLKTLSDFVNKEYPHIPAGTILLLTLDFDGASGTAAANVDLVLTFSEG